MIENSKEEVNIGVDYLESAVSHQKSANHKVYLVALLCFIIITFLCGLVFVVVKVIP
jgi:t-SNARE complex subunit (syntaxin)